jgi:crossover junction endodeoxyribonuclease RusA
MSTVLRLPYPISANRYWATRVSAVPGKRPTSVTYVTAEAKAYKEQVGWIAKSAGLRIPLDGRIELGLRLFPQRPQDWAKRAQRDPDTWDDDVRCIDLGNAEKVLSDALNGIAWIDDKQLRRIVSERCEPDGGARIEVTISPIRRRAIAPLLFEGDPCSLVALP